MLLLFLLCAPTVLAQDASQASRNNDSDAWRPLRFLVGTWEAKTTGGSAGAVSSGTYTFQLELRDHILARHTAGAGCKGPADFNCEHSDLLYVYQNVPGKPFHAIFFDNEGHVIHYGVSVENPETVIFLSDPSAAGPQYRLSYELKAGVMYGKFAMRMPGQPDFKPYLEWSGTKK